MIQTLTSVELGAEVEEQKRASEQVVLADLVCAVVQQVL